MSNQGIATGQPTGAVVSPGATGVDPETTEPPASDAAATDPGAARKVSMLDRILGRQPDGFTGPLSSFRERAGSHATWSSSWLQNSLRGAAALGLKIEDLLPAIEMIRYSTTIALNRLIETSHAA